MKVLSMCLAVGLGVSLGASIPSGRALAHEMQSGGSGSEVPCPHPATVHQAANGSSSVNAQDFPNPLPGGATRVLGQDGINKTFRYTFDWRPSQGRCCELSKATLTVALKWNGPAGPSSAANDTISIVHANSSVQGGYIWGPSSSTSIANSPYGGSIVPSPATKTIILELSPAVLAQANQFHRLSFAVQDDTTVQSADLELTSCCVNP